MAEEWPDISKLSSGSQPTWIQTIPSLKLFNPSHTAHNFFNQTPGVEKIGESIKRLMSCNFEQKFF